MARRLVSVAASEKFYIFGRPPLYSTFGLSMYLDV